jgi:predicted RNase H-like HicB family nuclease
MKTYTAVCVRSGDWWAIRVPELKGVHSQTKRLDQVEAMARDAIALFLEVEPGSFAVRVQPELPAEVSEALQARAEAKAADERADQATRTAAALLLKKGYSVRDAGRLLGLSPQRVSQITASHKPVVAA